MGRRGRSGLERISLIFFQWEVISRKWEVQVPNGKYLNDKRISPTEANNIAKNFFNYAFKGMDCEVDEQIAHIIQSVHQAGKPIGALCISPVLMAKILGNITITIGQDAKTARDIEQMGATNVNTSNGDVVTDKKNKIFSTPCYMLDANLVDIHEDAYNLVEAMMEYM